MIFSHDQSLFTISNIYHENNNKQLFLRWNWHSDVDEVLIYLVRPDDVITERLIRSLTPVRRISKREFGYGLSLALDTFERVRLVLFPCFQDGDELVVALQNDGFNELSVVPRTHAVTYRVHESTRLFSRVKTVRLEVVCDCEIPPSCLSYTLKSSGASYPIPFAMHAGENVIDSLPQLDKNETVQLAATSNENAERYTITRL